MTEERREVCKAHQDRTDYLDKVVWKGNGSKSLKDRMSKVETMLWVVIVLLLGNGSLLAWTLKTLSVVKK